MAALGHGGREGPQDRARERVNPAYRARDRVAAPAVDRKHDELVHDESAEDDQRLLEGRLGADLLVLAHGDVGDDGEGERMLSEHRSLEDIERETRGETQCDPAGTGRG